jgi:hypothetical protein
MSDGGSFWLRNGIHPLAARRSGYLRGAPPAGESNRSRFGPASSHSGFSPVSSLCVSTAIRSHAALAPNLPHGITPAASSFFSTSFPLIRGHGEVAKLTYGRIRVFVSRTKRRKTLRTFLIHSRV